MFVMLLEVIDGREHCRNGYSVNCDMDATLLSFYKWCRNFVCQ